MKKTTFCKLFVEIELDTHSENIAASTQQHSNPELRTVVEGFNDNILRELRGLGFTELARNPRYVSERNGGYALYNTLVLSEPLVQFKVLMDIRVADHPSKPSLVARNADRTESLEARFPELKGDYASLVLFDTYCKQHDWGVQVFIGRDADLEYEQPLSSIESAFNVIISKIERSVTRRFNDACDSILAKYDEYAVELAQDYLDDTEDALSILMRRTDREREFTREDLADLKLTYLDTGFEEGLFRTVGEFDILCDALRIKDKYK